MLYQIHCPTQGDATYRAAYDDCYGPCTCKGIWTCPSCQEASENPEAIIYELAAAVLDAGLELMDEDSAIFFSWLDEDEVRSKLPSWAGVNTLTR